MRTITPELEALLRSRFQAAGSGYAGRLVVASAAGEALRYASTDWRYLTDLAIGVFPADFADPDFDDSGWSSGASPFATVNSACSLMADPGVVLDTGVDTLLRHHVALPAGTTNARIALSVRDRVWVYWNGELKLATDAWASSVACPVRGEVVIAIPDDEVLADNVVAIRISDDPDGGSFIDASVFAVTGSIVAGVRRIGINRNLRMGPDQAEIELSNDGFAKGFGPSSVFLTNSRCLIEQWFGDPDNAVLTFTGVIDKIRDSREPLTTTLTCRSLAGAILVDQTFSTTAPQGADESGAVRTEDNGVYLAREVDYVVADILDRLGWPADSIDIADTSFVLDEYIREDGASGWDDLERLAAFVGYAVWDDEDAVLHFRTRANPAGVDDPLTADYEYEIGVGL